MQSVSYDIVGGFIVADVSFASGVCRLPLLSRLLLFRPNVLFGPRCFVVFFPGGFGILKSRIAAASIRLIAMAMKIFFRWLQARGHVKKDVADAIIRLLE